MTQVTPFDLIIQFYLTLLVRQLDTKCDVCSFSRFRDIDGVPKL